MGMSYSRQLFDQDQIEHFLNEVLRFDYQKETPKIIYDIIAGEKGLLNINVSEQTFNSTKYRDRKYIKDIDRRRLRQQIVTELFTLPRLDDDEQIELEKGGALPQSGVKSERQAFVVIGLPASGKSGICNQIAEQNGAMIIDSDYAKRKLPEYHQYIACGATIVHNESSAIIWGFDSESGEEALYQKATSNGYNIVIPTIGHRIKDLISMSEFLHSLGYTVHLTLVSLLRKEATIRAIKRYEKTKRYVPLGLIFDGYSNDPILNYYMIKSRFADKFNSYGVVTTNVNMGDTNKCLDFSGGTNPAGFYSQDLDLIF